MPPLVGPRIRWLYRPRRASAKTYAQGINGRGLRSGINIHYSDQKKGKLRVFEVFFQELLGLPQQGERLIN